MKFHTSFKQIWQCFFCFFFTIFWNRSGMQWNVSKKYCIVYRISKQVSWSESDCIKLVLAHPLLGILTIFCHPCFSAVFQTRMYSVHKLSFYPITGLQSHQVTGSDVITFHQWRHHWFQEPELLQTDLAVLI